MRSHGLNYQLPDDYNLFLWGDTQWGNVGVHENGIDDLFNMMAQDYRGCGVNYAIHLGDHIEAIQVGDPRFAFDQVVPKKTFLRAQIDHAIKRESVIAGNTLLVLKGNHEQKWFNTYGDIGAEIAGALGCDYGHYVCVANFHRKRTGRLMFRGFFHHGFGTLLSNAKDPEQQEANIKATLKMRLKPLMASCVLMVMGHTHQLHSIPPVDILQLVTMRGGDIKAVYPHRDNLGKSDQAGLIIHPDQRFYGNSGSFLRLYTEGSTSYAEMKGLKPVRLGFLVAVVRDCQLTDLITQVV